METTVFNAVDFIRNELTNMELAGHFHEFMRDYETLNGTCEVPETDGDTDELFINALKYFGSRDDLESNTLIEGIFCAKMKELYHNGYKRLFVDFDKYFLVVYVYGFGLLSKDFKNLGFIGLASVSPAVERYGNIFSIKTSTGWLTYKDEIVEMLENAEVMNKVFDICDNEYGDNPNRVLS